MAGWNVNQWFCSRQPTFSNSLPYQYIRITPARPNGIAVQPCHAVRQEVEKMFHLFKIFYTHISAQEGRNDSINPGIVAWTLLHLWPSNLLQTLPSLVIGYKWESAKPVSVQVVNKLVWWRKHIIWAECFRLPIPAMPTPQIPLHSLASAGLL